MKFQIVLVAAIMILVGIAACGQQSANDRSSYYLIRHAEKQLDAGNDPALTDAGRQRAQTWAEVLQAVVVDYVYSTDTIRTLDTARPIAEQHGLNVTIYSPTAFDYAVFADYHQGDTVVVVGHSNTTPAFANGLLGEEKYPELDESVYANLYIVDLIDGNGISRILTINP